MCKLKAKEKKESEMEIAFMAKVESINISNPCLLPLFNSFNFDFSFLILPDVISDNRLVLFL